MNRKCKTNHTSPNALGKLYLSSGIPDIGVADIVGVPNIGAVKKGKVDFMILSS